MNTPNNLDALFTQALAAVDAVQGELKRLGTPESKLAELETNCAWFALRDGYAAFLGQLEVEAIDN